MIFNIVVTTFFALALIGQMSAIGKPRKPITVGTCIANLIIYSVFVAAIWILQ